jgi:hypothetical protein
MYLPGQLPGRAKFISGELQAGGNSTCLCLTPLKATIDSLRILSWFVSYQRLTPIFQHYLPAAALGIYRNISVIGTLILPIKLYKYMQLTGTSIYNSTVLGRVRTWGGGGGM